jgi:hypothetical protein
MHYVYILRRADASFYVGSAEDINDRVEAHKVGPFSRASHERERQFGLVGPGQKKIGPRDGSYLRPTTLIFC